MNILKFIGPEEGAFWKISITKQHLALASNYASGMKPNSKTFMKDGAGIFPGMNGEVGILTWVPGSERTNGLSDDFTVPSGIFPSKIKLMQAKTKIRHFPPRMNDEASIPHYFLKYPQPDIYVFMSLLVDSQNQPIELYLLGFAMPPTSLITPYHEGKHDDSNNWTPTEPCLNIFHRHLIPPDRYLTKP